MQLMQSKLWTVIAACLCGTVLLSLAPAAEPKTVDTDTLLKRPQDYWSVGIAYKDAVLDAGRHQIKILEKTYYSVELKELGLAYASEQGLADIETTGLNRQYLLTGTVLYEKTGFFQNKDHYYIIILEADPTVITDTEEIEAGLDQLSLSKGPPETQHMLDVISTTQRELINLSKKLDVPVEELFDLDSENHDQARDIVRRALRKVEVTQDILSSEILSGFIFHMLSRKFSESPPESPKLPADSNEDREDADAEPTAVAIDEVPLFKPVDQIQKAPIFAVENLEPAAVLEREEVPAVELPTPPSKKQVEARDPKPALEKNKTKSSQTPADGQNQKTPVVKLDPALLHDKPFSRAVKPRKKAKLPIVTTSSTVSEDDIFAPVGR